MLHTLARARVRHPRRVPREPRRPPGRDPRRARRGGRGAPHREARHVRAAPARQGAPGGVARHLRRSRRRRPDCTPHYERFLELNEVFKQLCTDWQMRGDTQNDHTDAAYDAACVDRLTAAQRRLTPDGRGLRRGPAAHGPLRAAARRGRRQGGARRHQAVHRRDVQLVPRRLDGAPRGPDRPPTHRPRRRRPF